MYQNKNIPLTAIDSQINKTAVSIRVIYDLDGNRHYTTVSGKSIADALDKLPVGARLVKKK